MTVYLRVDLYFADGVAVVNSALALGRGYAELRLGAPQLLSFTDSYEIILSDNARCRSLAVLTSTNLDYRRRVVL